MGILCGSSGGPALFCTGRSLSERAHGWQPHRCCAMGSPPEKQGALDKFMASLLRNRINKLDVLDVFFLRLVTQRSSKTQTHFK